MATAGAVLSGWLLVVVVQHFGAPAYDLPTWAVALGGFAAADSAVAWLFLARTGGWFGTVVGVLGALIVASIVSIPVVGVVLLVAGVAGMARRQQQRRDRFALVAGMVIAFGVPVAALVASDGPVVSCRSDGGVATSSSLFRGASSSGSSGSGSSSPTAGTFTSGGRTYTYRCDDRGRLTDFEARDTRS